MLAHSHDLELGSDGSDVERKALDEIPYSCSILWTPIHPITWVAPFVGHMGITDSQGRLHDWGGGPIRPCTPRLMMFGEPARYIQLHPKDARAWDAAIAQADDEYSQYIHCMLLGSDCHSHVARVLNILRSGGCSCHNKVVLASAVCVVPRLMAVSLPRTFSPCARAPHRAACRPRERPSERPPQVCCLPHTRSHLASQLLLRAAYWTNGRSRYVGRLRHYSDHFPLDARRLVIIFRVGHEARQERDETAKAISELSLNCMDCVDGWEFFVYLITVEHRPCRVQ